MTYEYLIRGMEEKERKGEMVRRDGRRKGHEGGREVGGGKGRESGRGGRKRGRRPYDQSLHLGGGTCKSQR